MMYMYKAALEWAKLINGKGVVYGYSRIHPY